MAVIPKNPTNVEQRIVDHVRMEMTSAWVHSSGVLIIVQAVVGVYSNNKKTTVSFISKFIVFQIYAIILQCNIYMNKPLKRS